MFASGNLQLAPLLDKLSLKHTLSSKFPCFFEMEMLVYKTLFQYLKIFLSEIYKNLVCHSHDVLLPYITVEENFIINITPILKFYS